MQIGDCWFDAQEHLLVGASGCRWILSSDEYQVLSVLAKHRGKVVSRFELTQLLSSYVKGARRCDDTLDDVIKRLRSILGKKPYSLLDTVRGEGFILYPSSVSINHKLLDSPTYQINPLQFALIILVTLIALCGIGAHISHPTQIAPNYSQQIQKPNGLASEVKFYTGQYYCAEMKSLVEQMMGQIEACAVFPWQSVAANISIDRKLISFILRDNRENGLKFQTIKLMSDNFMSDTSQPDWLTLTGICS